jgi:large subunit ribosomal protein L17
MKTYSGRKLNRPTGPRMALLRGLATSLLRHEQITTTYAKAKEVSRFAETIIAKAKNKNLTTIRLVNSQIQDKDVSRKIYDVLVPRYQTRSGGCTRVFRLTRRQGDGAEMALVKLIS